jgi:hypothetical protein
MTALQETAKQLHQQLAEALETRVSKHGTSDSLVEYTEKITGWLNTGSIPGKLRVVDKGPEAGDRASSSSSGELYDGGAPAL